MPSRSEVIYEENAAIRNGWCKHTMSRRDGGKAFMNPRRRKRLKRRKEQGQTNRPRQIFSRRDEWLRDMYLAVKVLRMNNYKIPPDVFSEIICTGRNLMLDDDAKIKLRAAELMRKVVKDAAEIEVLELEKEALKNSGQAQEVHVRFDTDFFGNDAHQRVESKDATTNSEGERGSDGPASSS